MIPLHSYKRALLSTLIVFTVYLQNFTVSHDAFARTIAGKECTERLAGYGARKPGQCYDPLSAPVDRGRRPVGIGPRLIVLPAGAGHTACFAMTKYKISVGEYNLYCQNTKKCTPSTGDEGSPITGISLDRARAYAKWLSDVTRRQYTISTPEEWVHSASIGGPEKIGPQSFKCKEKQDWSHRRAGIQQPSFTSFQNEWGVASLSRDSKEWVVDLNGKIYVVSTSYQGNNESCTIRFEAGNNGKPDLDIGFRLVRPL